ncbi:MAG: FRG domain-containing protein, partial [Limisphaerales bacterium]
MKRILKGRPEGRIRTIRIERWSEFIRIVEGWDGFRNWAFRGQGNAAWELRSSLARHIEVSKVGERSWARQEVRIRRIFKRKAHLYLSNVPGEDELEWIALMQHHGAPTRLLDLSWSPYVAAFFALERATSEAAVWAFNLALLWQLHERHEIDGVAVNSADPRIAGIFDKYFQPNRHAFVWQGDPFRMPQRVIAQSGTFLVSGHLGRTIEEIIATYPGRDVLLVKFVFDTARVRADAMASLYSMNITQATLFPGLDGMARSMAYEFEYSWEV